MNNEELEVYCEIETCLGQANSMYSELDVLNANILLGRHRAGDLSQIGCPEEEMEVDLLYSENGLKAVDRMASNGIRKDVMVAYNGEKVITTLNNNDSTVHLQIPEEFTVSISYCRDE